MHMPAFAWREMRNDLMTIKLKSTHSGALRPSGQPSQVAIKLAGLCNVIDRKGEMDSAVEVMGAPC